MLHNDLPLPAYCSLLTTGCEMWEGMEHGEKDLMRLI
jgi:hypothetical protein